MNKKVMILLLALVVLVAGAAAAYNILADRVDTEQLSAGQTGAEVPGETQASVQQNSAPDFTVYDLEGNAHSLSDFRGKPVVLNFWASWCGPCKSEMPDFEEKYQLYKEDIHFLMVNLTDGSRETVDTAQGYIDGQGYTFPVYFDSDFSGAMAYAVSAVPATYFIDAEGALVAYAKRALSAEKLQTGIDMLMG